MTGKFKTGLKVVLLGAYLLAIAALLALALNQAVRLHRLRAGPALPGPAIGPLGYALAIAAVAAALFILVVRHPRRLLAVSLAAVLAFAGLNLYSGRHLLPQVLIWPSPVTLSEGYAGALAASDLEGALRLAGGTAPGAAVMTGVFQDHQSELAAALGDGWREAGLRDTSVGGVTTYYEGPMPQQLVFLRLETEEGKSAWLTLRMCYGPIVGTRYLCGAGMDSSGRVPGAGWSDSDVRVVLLQ